MARPSLAEKDILNPSEAIDYFVLSRRKFYDLLKNTDLDLLVNIVDVSVFEGLRVWNNSSQLCDHLVGRRESVKESR